MKHLIITIAAVLLVGCASVNPYTQYYTANENIGKRGFTPLEWSGSVELVSASDIEVNVERYLKDGYIIIGQSNFYGPSGFANDEIKIKEVAISVGADVVIYGFTYKDQKNVNVPTFNYIPGSVATTTSQYGTFTTTTPGNVVTGSQSVSVDRMDYVTLFLRKAPQPTLGINFGPIPDEMRIKMERNTGVMVSRVRNDTPAFFSGIIIEDVIIKVDDEDIIAIDDFLKVLQEKKGKKSNFTIIRKGKQITKEIQLN